MTAAKPAHAKKVDSLMERASAMLVDRRYFDAEREAVQALALAYAHRDYERMARILLPLQEARRQKRDLAVDAGEVRVVEGELPATEELRAGCYLIRPPRVGVDGRALRELADRAEVPVVVVVREPTTRDGLWPVVSIGPVTIRTKVRPPGRHWAGPGERPVCAAPAESGRKKRRGASKSGAGQSAGETVAPGAGRARGAGGVGGAGGEPAAAEIPATEWFLGANEAIGDAAWAEVSGIASPSARVDALMLRLQAHPDHEKLHQWLGDACREAVLNPEPVSKPRERRGEFDEDGEESLD